MKRERIDKLRIRIILFIVALFILILGSFIIPNLMTGFNILLEGNNFASISKDCQKACEDNAKSEYCILMHKVQMNEISLDVNDGESYTCDYLSKIQPFGIETCPKIQPC